MALGGGVITRLKGEKGMSVVSFFSLKIHKTTRVLHTHTNSALQNRRHLPSTNVGRRNFTVEDESATPFEDEVAQDYVPTAEVVTEPQGDGVDELIVLLYVEHDLIEKGCSERAGLYRVYDSLVVVV